MKHLLSPRGKAETSDDDLLLLGHVRRLLLEEPCDELLAKLSKPLVDLLLSPMIVDRLCYEIGTRGYAHGIFRVPGAGFRTKAVVLASVYHLKLGDEVVYKAEDNVHNVAAALTLYLTKTVPILTFAHYEALFRCIRDIKAPAEQAVALSGIIERLPKRKTLQRVIKLLADCAEQSESNQMTPQNLAIVFAPVLFHDETEPLSTLAQSQRFKMAVIEICISFYKLVFPTLLVEVYIRPPKPGEVPLLTERDWSLLTAKHAELITLEAGDVLVEKNQQLHRLYRVKRGVILKEMSGNRNQRLIGGDFFGHRALLGRLRSNARFVAEDDVELWSLNTNHLSSIWNVDTNIAAAFWGHVALSYSLQLRGQILVSESSIVQSRMSRMSVGGLRFSKVLQEEDLASLSRDFDDEGPQMPEDILVSPLPAADAIILEKECQLKKRFGRIVVTALEIRFESDKGPLSASKTVSIPYEAFERISTSVPDHVIRGKRHASKIFSKKKTSHSITLTVRKRKQRSYKQSQRILKFFCEADAAEVFICACKLFLTVSEETLSDPAKKFKQLDDETSMGANESENSDKIVSKAVALFDYADEESGFSFKVGDIVFLTTNRRDLRVRGRTELNPSLFAMFPRDYVEVIVWCHNVRNLPNEGDLEKIFSCGTKKTFRMDEEIMIEGEIRDSLCMVVSGLCRVVKKKSSLGKLTRGDLFGEISFLLGGQLSASVIAHSDQVEIIELSGEVLRATFAMRVDLAAKFYKLFSSVNLRRIERNLILPYQERKRVSVMYSTTQKSNNSIDALL